MGEPGVSARRWDLTRTWGSTGARKTRSLQRQPLGTPRLSESLHLSPCLILGAGRQLWEGPGFSAVWFSAPVPRPYGLQTWVTFG